MRYRLTTEVTLGALGRIAGKTWPVGTLVIEGPAFGRQFLPERSYLIIDVQGGTVADFASHDERRGWLEANAQPEVLDATLG